MSGAESLAWSIDCSAAMPSSGSGGYTTRAAGITERSIDGSGSPADPMPDGARILRRWEAGRTDRLNEAHWADAHGQPIDHDLAFDLPTLRARAAHECHNNPIVEGVIGQHAIDVVAIDGPTLEVMSDDDRYNTRLESRFREWAEIADANGEMGLVEILQLWVKQIWTAGALLGQEVTDDTGSRFPAMVRLHALHANRLETPWGRMGDPNIAFGVRRTRGGRPLEYFISQPKHFGPHRIETGEFLSLRPEFVYHDYIRSEPGQSVGYPLLASALPSIADLRDYDRSVLDAARLAADRSEWFVNINPDGEKFQGETDANGNTVGFEVGYKRMTTRAAPPGWDVRAHEAIHPTANYVEHRRERMAEVGRAAAMPLMLIRLDSSNHNYSSARFDQQGYLRHIQSWQSWLGRRHLSRMVGAMARELALEGDLPRAPQNVRLRWNWPPPPQVDPTKERGAERLGLMNRTLTFANACRATNQQEEDVIASWARTRKRLVDAGFSEPEIAAFLAGITRMSPSGGATGTPNAARNNSPATQARANG